MKVNLFVSYYIDKNEERRREILSCMEKNLVNPNIDRIISFTERPTYKSMFEATKYYPDDINIIANSDIYFDESIDTIKEFFTSFEGIENKYYTCLALTRWDVLPDGSLNRFVDRGSQDVWVFYGSVNDIDQMFCDFHLGKPGCDNRIAYELKESAGYALYNPSEEIRTIHLHNSGIRNYNPGRKIPGPHLLLDFCSVYNFKDTKYYIRSEEEVGQEITGHYNEEALLPVTTTLQAEIPQLKVLHIALMAGDNGFTRELEKLGEYHEINYHHYKDEFGIDSLNLRIKVLINELKPDLVFCQLQEPGIIHKQTFEEISKISKCIVWTGDIRHETPAHLEELYTTVHVCYSNERDALMKDMFLQIGIDPEIFKPLSSAWPDDIRDNKIVFMGNNYGSGHFPLSLHRLEMVEDMEKEFNEKFRIYGVGYSFPTSDLNGDQYGENVIYNSAKIGISYSHFKEERYCSDRLLRIMASGCMALSHYYPGIEKDFEIGVHLDVFHNLEELKYKCYHYLNNEEKRKTIAAAGQKLVHEKFTFRNMVENIYSIYQTIK